MRRETAQNLRRYRGPVTDNEIWSRFALRPDDIIVNTPPKCGTTWMLNIVMMLIHGRVVPDAGGAQHVPWLDFALRDRDAMAAALDGMDRRRCIKSHTPLDGVPVLPEPTYLVVYRHPIDVHFSMRDHVVNMKFDLHDYMYAGDTRANFTRFLTQPATDTGTDDLSLASIAHHFNEAKARAGQGNLHFFHYADMTRDLRGQIARVARLMGVTPDPDLLDEIAEATTFKAMRKALEVSERRFSEDSVFHDAARFFACGRSRSWEGMLSAEDMAAYATRLTALIPDAADRDWLEWGDRSG